MKTSDSNLLGPWVYLLMTIGVAGCHGPGSISPVVDVLGSYFPAWMICIASGLGLTLIARLVFIALKLDLHPAAIVYPCLMVVFTMATWLAFFQN